MKPRDLVPSIERPSLCFFAVSKVVLLASLVAIFLNVTLSLYTYFSSHYYLTIRQPVLKVYSSVSSSASNLSEDSRIASTSLFNNSPFSSSVSVPTKPSLLDYNSVSSVLLPSPPLLLRPSEHPKLDHQVSPSSNISSKYSNSSYLFKSVPFKSSINFISPSARIPSAKRPTINKQRIPKGCDLSKGEWVPDLSAPYYTNLSCMMIQEHQNCMKFGKPNLDFLKWRWKPDGCELPLLDPAQFLDFMWGKNLAFIGDSLARNQMQSLICLLSRVEHPKETPHPSEEKVTRMAYAEHNFTIWSFWSPFLIRAEEINRSTHGSNLKAWNLFLDEPDPLWPGHLPTMDHIVVNTGIWYTRPALFHLRGAPVGCHYCPIPDAPFMSIRRANRRAFRTALDAVASGITTGGVAVVRTVSPAHFEGGEWDKGGDCGRTRPFRPRKAPKLGGVEMDMYREQLKEFWRVKWEGSERGLEMRLLDATRAMLMRPDGHPSRYGHWPEEERVMYNDCVHWCLPGPVDMWNDFLFRMLTS